jgi:hypothetical protein
MLIAVGLFKLVPVMVTRVPTGPLLGSNEFIVGEGGIKIKPESAADPPAAVRLTAPVAPEPITARIELEEITVNEVTLVSPKVIAEVPNRLFPVIVIIEPAPPEDGVKLVIVGAAIKLNPSKVAMPPGVTRLKAPVAPLPTAALMVVEETIVNEATLVPPSVIAEVPVRFVPLIVIIAPLAAAVGLKLVIVG